MAMPVVKCIPLMYHPGNTVFLDDDPKFLHNLCMNLALTIPYVQDTNPQLIMDYLKSHSYNPEELSALMIKRVGDDAGSRELYVIDLSPFIAMLASPARFKKANCAMVDRAMKETSGIKFCHSIREENIPIKVNLFTGQTTADEAVQLFNQKIIDGFLIKKKNMVELAEEVNSVIFQQTWQQFVDFSEKLGGLISHVLKALHDEQFISVFMHLYEKYKIVEFYIVDSSCSYILIDADGKVRLLYVRNENDFKDCYELAENSKPKVPHEILEALRARQMFPYTGDKIGYEALKSDQWERAMVSMNKVPGRELYYAVIDRPDIEVFSFNQYMQEEWPNP